MLHTEPFAGDKKIGGSILGPLEQRAIRYLIPKIPGWIHGYHLTYTTLLWSGSIVLFSYLAQNNIHWLWLVSFMIFCQYVSDSLDGSLNKHRKLGLIRWGYYMDHFLDYIFLCSILIGYSFLFNDKFNTLFFLLAVFGAFMVNSYVSFSATNEFKIVYLKIGPTEVRFLFIIINTLLIFFHKTYLVGFLPYVLVFATLGLIVTVYQTQKEIWEKDIEKNVDEKNTIT